MYQQTYFVDKQTGTFADVCSAYGLATILDGFLRRVLGEHGSRTVRILDRGTTFAIELAPRCKKNGLRTQVFLHPSALLRQQRIVEQ